MFDWNHLRFDMIHALEGMLYVRNPGFFRLSLQRDTPDHLVLECLCGVLPPSIYPWQVWPAICWLPGIVMFTSYLSFGL